MNKSSYENRENDKLYQQIKQILDNDPTMGRQRIKQILPGIGDKACRNRIKWYRRDHQEDEPREPQLSIPRSKFDNKGDTAEAEFISDEPCKTVADVIRKGDIDISIWDIERFILNSWEMGYKDSEGIAKAKPLWQVKVWLKRKIIDTEKIIEAVTDRMKAHSPVVASFHNNLKKTGYMWELDIIDLHVGKFSWKPETGYNWDVKLAVEANNKAVDELYSRAIVNDYQFEKILIPIGNDLLHVDNMLGETTKGTKQDCDGRVLKMFKVTLDMLINQIDRLKTIARVHILIMAGNHDLLSTMYLGLALWAYYHNDKNVTVDYDPISRKYIRFGRCLIGFCHGCSDDPNPNMLPFTMSNEHKEGWVNAVHRTWHIGHTHKSKQISFVCEDSFQGITVRTIRSLTPPDLWHFNHAYINPDARGAEAFIWHKEDGMIQHNLTYAKD